MSLGYLCLRERVQDYDAVMTNPQVTRYIAEYMQQTSLLRQFRFECCEEAATEPEGLLGGIELDDEGYRGILKVGGAASPLLVMCEGIP